MTNATQEEFALYYICKKWEKEKRKKGFFFF